MDDINGHYLNWRRRIRDLREVRAVRFRERLRRVMKEGDLLRYQGNSHEVGCFVSGVALSKGNRYFEVTIRDTGVRGMIAVGLVPLHYKLDHQPGWLPRSVTYHADDGQLYNGQSVGQQFGPKCNRGDRMGCGIYRDTFHEGQITVFFTKNGKEVGRVDVAAPGALFPAVGMLSVGEEVQLDLQAEWLTEEDEGLMMVDGHEDDWARLHDVRVTGNMLEYVGKGKSISDVGLAQARRPLGTRCHYYELEIASEGDNCYIAVGLARRDYPKNRHPGWSRGSIAYHADDGKMFHGHGVGEPFGPRCFEGDIMGCGIMFPRDYSLDSGDDMEEWEELEASRGRQCPVVQNELYMNNEEDEDKQEADGAGDRKKVTVFFTRNGVVVGRREEVLPAGGFYPTVGMMSSGERVRVDLHPLSG